MNLLPTFVNACLFYIRQSRVQEFKKLCLRCNFLCTLWQHLEYLCIIYWPLNLLLLRSWGISWWTVLKINVCWLKVLLNFLLYKGNIYWPVDTGKAPNWANGQPDARGQMCMSKTWLVDEGADFTGCACKTREIIVCPLMRLFLHEYQVEECNVKPLVAVIANSCKVHMPSPYPHIPPPSARDLSRGTGLGRADIIFFASAQLTGSVESDATGARKNGANKQTLFY